MRPVGLSSAVCPLPISRGQRRHLSLPGCMAWRPCLLSVPLPSSSFPFARDYSAHWPLREERGGTEEPRFKWGLFRVGREGGGGKKRDAASPSLPRPLNLRPPKREYCCCQWHRQNRTGGRGAMERRGGGAPCLSHFGRRRGGMCGAMKTKQRGG